MGLSPIKDYKFSLLSKKKAYDSRYSGEKRRPLINCFTFGYYGLADFWGMQAEKQFAPSLENTCRSYHLASQRSLNRVPFRLKPDPP